jgi:hypothetical protein
VPSKLVEVPQFSRDGRYLALLAYRWVDGFPRDCEIRVYEGRTGRLLWTRPCWISPDDPSFPFRVQLFPASSQAVLALGDEGSRVDFLDPADGTVQASLPLRGSPQPFTLSDISFNSNARFLVMDAWAPAAEPPALLAALGRWLPGFGGFSEKGRHRRWVLDVEKRRELMCLDVNVDEFELTEKHFTPDGRTLIVADQPNPLAWKSQGSPSITCWDVPARKPWGWVLGPPLGLAGSCLGLRTWRRRRMYAARKQDGAGPSAASSVS